VSETPTIASAAALREAVVAGSASARSHARASLARMDAVRAGADHLNIVLWRDDDDARHQAAAIDDGEDTRGGLLAGVPVCLKDNIATTTLPTTCGSKILRDFVSPYRATVVDRLRAAGAVVVGKTNMDEFAMGSSTENSAYGPARNPVATDRVPGGSSGGSAAVVAAGIVPISLGSETGGSVRQPAAFCGVVGVKPTYGRVSRFGLVAFASSLDQVGVFGACVDDAATGLQVIAGRDPADATSVDVEVPDYRASAHGSLQGVVVGIPREYFPDHLEPHMRAKCDRSIEHLKRLGAEIREVTLPHSTLAIPAYYVIAPAEASSNLARFDGVRYGLRIEGGGLAGMYEATRSGGFGDEVIRRILLGTFVLSAGYYDAYYKKAQQVRALISMDFERVFAGGVHLLFTPTTPTPAFKLGQVSDPYEMYLSDVFTAPANLVGVPAMSQPIGRVDGLPVGGQFIAPHFQERQMFAAAYALERALGAEIYS